MQQSCGFLLFADDGVDLGADVVDERRGEADAGVVPFHGVFDQVHVDVGCFAGAVALVAAEEVQVFGAVPVHGALDDHPLGDPRAAAATAEH
ncbi:hypothetical protein [Saccharomonospora azurea]